MFSELVAIKFHKIMQTRAYTVIVLGTDEKQFAIYTDAAVGKALQLYLTDTTKARPYTYDLISMLLTGFNMRIMQIVINDIQDTVYFARLFVKQSKDESEHIVEIDARPSDCITLAIIHNIPVYCTKDVLEKTLPLEGVV